MKKINIIQILNEMAHVKEEKNRVVRTQNYAHAANLRDREKQLLKILFDNGIIDKESDFNPHDIMKTIVDRRKNVCDWILNDKYNEF
jgi:hypothetical protein